jgi:gamma-glutamylcyclotransferase
VKALYFAYGSNLDPAQMRERLPRARAVGVARLPDHELAFHKPGRDGSGKASLVAAPGGEVWGALYEVELEDLHALDAFEGGYVRVSLTVRTGGGEIRQAASYRSDRADPHMAPARWYAARVLRGARAHGLPCAYVTILEATLEARRSCPP